MPAPHVVGLALYFADLFLGRNPLRSQSKNSPPGSSVGLPPVPPGALRAPPTVSNVLTAHGIANTPIGSGALVKSNVAALAYNTAYASGAFGKAPISPGMAATNAAAAQRLGNQFEGSVLIQSSGRFLY